MSIVTQYLASVGSTGDNTHQSVGSCQAAEKVSFNFRVTAVGATPTVTFVFQGSMDDTTVADADSVWQNLFVIPTVSDTGTATPAAVTAVSDISYFLPAVKFFKKYRVVTSSNTNVTYEATLQELSC